MLILGFSEFPTLSGELNGIPSDAARNSDPGNFREQYNLFFFCCYISGTIEYMETTPTWDRSCQGKSPEDVPFGWVMSDGEICHHFL
jgi:hypothetical protein